MDWKNITKFEPKEFPSQKEIDLTDPRLFRTLEDFRLDLNYSVYPSPEKGALAREYGSTTSRHYAVGKLSTAIDFFPDCDILRALFTAVHYFGGVGVYFDTHFKRRKWVMLHGDLRLNTKLWYRLDGKYHTINTDADYYTLLELINKHSN